MTDRARMLDEFRSLFGRVDESLEARLTDRALKNRIIALRYEAFSRVRRQTPEYRAYISVLLEQGNAVPVAVKLAMQRATIRVAREQFSDRVPGLLSRWPHLRNE